MKLLTAFELANQNEADLSRLFRDVMKELARTEPETIERSKALASLENISQAIGVRLR